MKRKGEFMMKAIAVDGPSGAGKSTMVKAIAARLGYVYVDTGAIYRSVGLFASRAGIPRTEIAGLIPRLDEIGVALSYEDGQQKIFLNGEDVTKDIRTPEISLYASAVSALPEVRSKLLSLQRELAKTNNVIMDGRDIGTVVLPDADVKIFLTASAEERARRRYEELKDKGMDVTYDQTLKEVCERDANDENRAVAPLRPAEDAVIVDTTGKNIEESLALLFEVIAKKLCEGEAD